jgi:hypothetical protein
VRVASDLWLALHRVEIGVPGGAIALAPLAGAAVPAWWCWVAGRRVGAAADRRGSRGERLRRLAPSVLCLAVGYAVVTCVVAAAAGDRSYRPVLWQAVVAGLVVAGVPAGVAALRAAGLPVAGTVADALRLPQRVRRTARTALASAAAVTAVGGLLVALSLLVHLDRVLALHRALDPGVVGGAVLTAGQAALVPNLALWGVGFLAGPGFARGAGTTVSAGGSTLGLLPLVPLLGGAPPPGPLPAIMWCVVAVPVVVGALAGRRCVRALADRTSLGEALADALTAAAIAAAVLTVALALSGGAAGPGALRAVGPSPWRCGLALAGELAAGAAAAGWLTHRRRVD